MPVKKTSAAAKKPAAPASHSHKELEAKILKLESQILELVASFKKHEEESKKEHEALAKKCDICCESKPSSGSDKEAREAIVDIVRCLSNPRATLPDVSGL